MAYTQEQKDKLATLKQQCLDIAKRADEIAGESSDIGIAIRRAFFKKKPGTGKDKGGGFERDMCEKISLWLTNGERKDLLCRTVSSGGQYTKTKGGLPGDLRAQHPLAFNFCERFIFECKFWADLEIFNFLMKEGMLYQALEKVRKEAEQEKKSWWLIAKQNNRKILLFLPSEAMANSYTTYPLRIKFHAIFNGTVHMYVLDEFLSSLSADQLLGKYSTDSNAGST